MDKQLLIQSIEKTNNDTEMVTAMLDSIVHEYSGELDELMMNIQSDIIYDNCPAIVTIENYFVKLSGCLYFMCEQSERLGIFDSISKAKAQDTYNTKYLEHQSSNVGVGTKKPTVAESSAVAETAALYDQTVNDIYSKAYKILKNKISAAETMVSTLSKILSHRIQESSMTTSQVERRILNEEQPF